MVLMAKKDIEEGISNLKSDQDDIKRHLRIVPTFVAVGIKDNLKLASDIRYITNQIGCHDSRIDDHDRDLK